jgi:hypothetical protein
MTFSRSASDYRLYPKPNRRHSGVITQAVLESRVNIEPQKTGLKKYRKMGQFERFSTGFSTVAGVTRIGANRYKRSF